MSNRYYSEDHICFIPSDSGEIKITLSDYLLSQIKPNYINLPNEGDFFPSDAIVATLESNKFALEISLPFDCEIQHVNHTLENSPERLSSENKEEWLFKIRTESPSWKELLMDSAEYATFIEP